MDVLADGLEQLDQATLGSRGGVLVNQVITGCPIQLLLGQTKLGLCRIAIARFNSFAKSTNLGSHITLSRTIADPKFLVLAKAFQHMYGSVEVVLIVPQAFCQDAKAILTMLAWPPECQFQQSIQQ